MEITIKDLENDLKSLPKELLQQVGDYVAFLKQKYNGQVNEDWASRSGAKAGHSDPVKNSAIFLSVPQVLCP